MPKVQKKDIPIFGAAVLEGLASALSEILSHRDITRLLGQAKLKAESEGASKPVRIFNAFASGQNEDKSGHRILSFIANALSPARYSERRGEHEPHLAKVNVPLAFVGLRVTSSGKFGRADAAETLDEAHERAGRLKKALEDRQVHPDVLAFCRAELLVDNYFHAVLEATKSVAEKIRKRTKLATDGAELVRGAFGGPTPVLRINSFAAETARGEQRGFANLLTGMFGVFRNTTAHAPKVTWPMNEQDALDLMVLASYAHRRIDAAK